MTDQTDQISELITARDNIHRLLNECANPDCSNTISTYASRLCHLHQILDLVRYTSPEQFQQLRDTLDAGFRPYTEDERKQISMASRLDLIHKDAVRLRRYRDSIVQFGADPQVVQQAIYAGLNDPTGGDL